MKRFFGSVVLALVICFLGSCASRRSSSALSISQNEGGGGAIRLQEVSARVLLAGGFAETTLEITVGNREDRDVEAHLDLPLPEGASISSYALEVDGRLREGTIVEKQVARVAFEETTRRNIDPGLLEKTGGNRFRTRIYPVPAKGTKRLRLSYLEPLKADGAGSHYQLPIPEGTVISKFSFAISTTDPATTITPGQAGGLSFAKRNFRRKALSFQMTSASPRAQVFAQSGRDGRRYFHLTDPLPALPEVRRPVPGRILLVWDASNSGNLRDHRKELELLEGYFGTLANTTIDLHLLRNIVTSAASFPVHDGDWSSLHQVLKNLSYDGATRLDHLDLRAPDYDQVLLVSDGLSTMGSGKIRYGKIPVFTLHSSPQAHHGLLKHLARETGGAVLDLDSGQAREALNELIHQRPTLLRVTGAGLEEVLFDTLAGKAVVRGRLATQSTTVTLHYGANGVTRFRRNIRLGGDGIRRGNIAPKLWAQAKADRLDINSKQNREEIVAHAKTHHLVTAHTSLLVLDRLEDYLTHGIVPADPNLRKDYLARKREQERFDGSQAADLDAIYQDWKELVAWHQGAWKNKKQESVDEAPLPLNSPPAPAMVMPMMSGDDADFSGIVTGGLRSGSSAVSQNSIDGLLNQARASVKIKDWQSGAPYLRDYEEAARSSRPLLPVYQKWKAKYHLSPGFYLESADFFADRNQPLLAARILSNLAELSPESPELLRILAHRYGELGEHRLAEMLFREVADLRAEEPQSHRDLALALIELGRVREAEELLWKVISRRWSPRFEGLELIVLNEWNHLHRKYGKRISLRPSGKRFRHVLDTDLRILISWDTDNSDMDLWVTDPAGEKCFYSNPLTKVGGRISADFTNGRGPEEFMIRKAPAGSYAVQAHYYGTRQQTEIGPTTLHATLITNWGRSNEKRKHLTFQLGSTSDEVEIGKVDF